MATTTNYGWTTPDDVSLVKDGAAAIRTLGSSVDTTTKALNPSTTLGDIEYRSSTANTNTRLGIGPTGQFLSVVGGVPAWATPSSGSMTLLSTTTLSGSATTVSSINQTYKDLLVTVSDATWDTANDSGVFTCNLSSVTSYTIIYTASVLTSNLVTNIGSLSDGTQDWLRTGGNNFSSLYIQDYAATTRYKTFQGYVIYQGTSANGRLSNVLGGFASDTAIDTITFKLASNHNQTGGTMRIYGVN